MLKSTPPLCEEHSEKLASVLNSQLPERNALVGGFLVGCESCTKCNPPGNTVTWGWLSHRDQLGTLHEKEECAVCLAQDWRLAFSRALGKVIDSFAGSIEGYLRARAELKAAFPGYPTEMTSGKGYFSTEGYLLKEGKTFRVTPLTEKE